MHKCASCEGFLVKRRTSHGWTYACKQCGGRSVALSVLRRAGAKTDFLGALWQKARAKRTLHVRPCPHCRRRMAQVSTQAPEGLPALDVCTQCALVWFDHNELKPFLEAFPRDNAEPQPREASLESRERLALTQLERVKVRHRDQALSQYPEEGWHWLVGLLGLPVEVDAPQRSTRPWVTWAVAAACTGILLYLLLQAKPPLTGPEGVFRRWGFVPAQWARYGGLTLITSFFLHGGLLHLLGNMYFLLVFGDNVEDHVGRGWFVMLLLAAHGAGMWAQAAFGPDPSVPCVGASAGISGVIAYYAIVFPRARLGLVLRYWFFFRWFTIPAIWALVLYFLMQLLGAYVQIKGFGGVSYLGHLGGLVVGVAAALTYKCMKMGQISRALNP